MKKLITLSAIGSVMFLTACNFGATEDSANEDTINTTVDIAAQIDSTAKSMNDSLSASVDSATKKLKEGVNNLKEGAQALGKVVGEKANQGANTAKEKAQKVGDAVKQGVETTKEALKTKN